MTIRQQVTSPDGRRWTVRSRRVGVANPMLASNVIGLGMWLLGGAYHVLFRRGEFRVEAIQPQRGWRHDAITWDFGVFRQPQADALATLVTQQLLAGAHTFDQPTL